MDLHEILDRQEKFLHYLGKNEGYVIQHPMSYAKLNMGGALILYDKSHTNYFGKVLKVGDKVTIRDLYFSFNMYHSLPTGFPAQKKEDKMYYYILCFVNIPGTLKNGMSHVGQFCFLVKENGDWVKEKNVEKKKQINIIEPVSLRILEKLD